MNAWKRSLALLLAISLLCATFSSSVFAVDAGCGDCGNCPTIVVHGIGQSKVSVTDPTGAPLLDRNGSAITRWPIYIDGASLALQLVSPLLRTLITQRDAGLTEKVYQAGIGLLKYSACGVDGTPLYPCRVEQYPHSLALCTQEEKDYIYAQVPLQELAAKIGEDHMYYCAYDSFGQPYEAAAQLYDYLQMAKRETGHSRINLVFISLGGTVANAFWDAYPQAMEEVNRVVYIVAALNGTKLVSDLMRHNTNFADDALYHDLFPQMIGGAAGYLANLLIRLLPKEVCLSVFDRLVDAAVDGLLLNCPALWALVPREDYPALSDQYLSGTEHAAVRAQTDRYYRAQLRLEENLRMMQQKGVEVFSVCEYNVPFFPLVASTHTECADGLINASSTSLGARTCKIGETFPADYRQEGTYCKNASHHHISPDRTVDASAGLLPDATWYFYNQKHELTAQNDVLIRLAVVLCTNPAVKDVYSDARFPQFNGARSTGYLQNELLPLAREAVESGLLETLPPAEGDELTAAIGQAEAMLRTTLIIPEETEAAVRRLEAIMGQVGLIEQPSRAETFLRDRLELICKTASEAVFRRVGPQGFWD